MFWDILETMYTIEVGHCTLISVFPYLILNEDWFHGYELVEEVVKTWFFNACQSMLGFILATLFNV